jgi:hypothetical protein
MLFGRGHNFSMRKKGMDSEDDMKSGRNVLGENLEVCGNSPKTGYYRSGVCETGPEDRGSHVICAWVTAEFLDFTKEMGNDLSTPSPALGFPGLKSGDRWCLCALRWKEALDAGVAPPVILEATHEAALRYVSLEDLKRFAVGASRNPGREETG